MSVTNELAQEIQSQYATVIPFKRPGQLAPPPLHVLPDKLRAFIESGAASLNCPPDFLFMPLLTVAGVAIGGSRIAKPKSDWGEYPVLWTGIVGPPSAGKTPALNIVTAPLKEEQRQLKVEFDESMEEYKRLLKLWQQDSDAYEKPEMPTQKLAFSSDVTTEALRDLLTERPRGVMLLQDELAGWVKSFNQYKTSGNDRQVWLSMWSSEMAATARKSSRVLIEKPIVPVLGGLQPDVLNVLTTEGRDGFTARLLLMYPDRIPLKYTNVTIPSNLSNDWDDAYKKLCELSAIVGKQSDNSRTDKATYDKDSNELSVLSPLSQGLEMNFTKEAQEVFVTWMNDKHLKEIESGNLSLPLEDAWAKLRTYVVRISLILQCIWHVSGDEEFKDGEISMASVVWATEIVEYVKKHLRKSYQSMDKDPQEDHIEAIMNWIKEHDYSATSREIHRADILPRSINTASKIKELFHLIEDHGYGVIEKKGKSVILKIPNEA